MPMRFEALSIPALRQFRAIVGELDRIDTPGAAKTLKEVGERLEIKNVPGFLLQLQSTLKSRQPLIVSTPGVGNPEVTDAGRTLNEFASRIEHALNLATDPALDVRLTLACGQRFAAVILPRLLRAYLRISRDFREIVVMERLGPPEVLERVRNESVDFGISLHWPDHGLFPTPLITARRGIWVSKDYWPKGEPSEEEMSQSVMVTYDRDILRPTRMEGTFPDPKDGGVRILVRGENTVAGWLESGVGFGHLYHDPVPRPPSVREVWADRIEGFQPSTWFAYTRFHLEKPTDAREEKVKKIIEAMQKAASSLITAQPTHAETPGSRRRGNRSPRE